MNIDKLISHRDMLENKHKDLDNEIKLSYSNYVSDEDLKLHKLKKLELKRQLDELNQKIDTIFNKTGDDHD